MHDDGTVRQAVNGTASELWSLAPALQKFVQDVVEPRGIATIQIAVTSPKLLLFSMMLLGMSSRGDYQATSSSAPS